MRDRPRATSKRARGGKARIARKRSGGARPRSGRKRSRKVRQVSEPASARSRKVRPGSKPASERPSWDRYFLEIAQLLTKRSTCLRRQVGALIVKDKRILATGYNGAPTGIEHCSTAGCLREKLKVPPGERHELCLPPNEEILSNEGYITIGKIKLGQKVLTHRGVYRKITQIFKRKYRGLLYLIEPWSLLPVALTPEHPVLAMRAQRCQFDIRTLCKETCRSVNNNYCNTPYLSYQLEWVPASKLKEKDLVLLPFDNRSLLTGEMDFSFVACVPSEYYKVLEERSKGASCGDIKKKLSIWPSTAYNWVNGGAPRNCMTICNGTLIHGSSPSKTIPSKIKLTKEFLRIIGFYLAEGCSSLNQISFSFNRKEKEAIREVKNSMKEIFDLDCYEYKRRNGHKLVYSSIILAKAFKVLFGGDAYTKRLPHFLMGLSPEEQRSILTAYALGDGYKQDANTTSITTASRDLALQVIHILFRSGYLPVIDRGSKGRNAYRVIWKDRFKISYGYLKENIFFSPIRKIWTKEYSGYVYNLEVEEDNSYVTKSFIVHNCRGLHAEQNALLQAARYGLLVAGAVLYSTNQPCIICTKMLINAGINEIVTLAGYPDKPSEEFLKKAKIRVKRIKL